MSATTCFFFAGKDGAIQVFNALGTLLKDITPGNKMEEKLDMTSLQPGVYIVTVKTNTSSWTGKVIKAE